MNKKLVSVFILIIFACLATAGFAAQQTAAGKAAKEAPVSIKAELVLGKIVSIDKAKLQITVKDEKSNMDKHVTVTEKEMKGLNVGEKVEIQLKPGTNIAEKVLKMK